MELKHFIEETLSEIIAGIRAAQQRPGGGAVGAQTHGTPTHDNLFSGGTSGVFTIVDFDVSVAAADENRIQVMSIVAEQGVEPKSHESSRVKFAVQVRIPDGYKVQPAEKFLDKV